MDAIVLHPVSRTADPRVVLFLVFQAVFAWAQWPMDAIKSAVSIAAVGSATALPSSLFKDLLINGVLAGVGSVLVFLPQIMILFFFILVLEDSGYLPRAAFLLDRVMGSVGSIRTRVHPAAVRVRVRDSRHHGDAHDPESARSAGDDHDRAVDDLFCALAGIRADHRRIHPAPHRLGRNAACRDWCCSRCTSPASSAQWRSPTC